MCLSAIAAISSQCSISHTSARIQTQQTLLLYFCSSESEKFSYFFRRSFVVGKLAFSVLAPSRRSNRSCIDGIITGERGMIRGDRPNQSYIIKAVQSIPAAHEKLTVHSIGIGLGVPCHYHYGRSLGYTLVLIADIAYREASIVIA